MISKLARIRGSSVTLSHYPTITLVLLRLSFGYMACIGFMVILVMS
ncbi:hypothetical protein F383_27406 [Gossypium arboreum]|uniref:Uncharacterized protein n=1 Tax=Gossypium arboreum TaxID=29729 RepID=A0A0B0MNR8_GOSAR|nr:hypothetical protein F383_27406 [Gossypium arboreum]